MSEVGRERQAEGEPEGRAGHDARSDLPGRYLIPAGLEELLL